MGFGRDKIGCFWQATLRIIFLAISMTASLVLAQAQDGPPGITKRTVLPSFNPNAPACSPPSHLKSALAYVQENRREFLQGVDHGLALATKQRGLEYFNVVVENDVAKAI